MPGASSSSGPLLEHLVEKVADGAARFNLTPSNLVYNCNIRDIPLNQICDICGALGLPPPKPSAAKLIRLPGTCKVFGRTSASLSARAEELSGAGRSLVNKGHWR